MAAGPRTQGGPTSLTVPAMDGQAYLGDVEVTLDPSGRPMMSSRRIVDLISPLVEGSVAARLQAWGGDDHLTGPGPVDGTGVAVAFDAQTVELSLSIPPTARASRPFQVAAPSELNGGFDAPARLSAYLNARGSIDDVQRGPDGGLHAPILYLDGAARADGVVLESQGLWRPGVAGAAFQRQATRFVFDQPAQALRWSAGDLVSQARGYQGALDIAGVSVLRSYGVLQPQSIVHPTGRESFQLARPGTVEMYVNGLLVRRVQLPPGAYDLRDFPFTQGANDVRVVIDDGSGQTEALRFNQFVDQTQLSRGLDEFGLAGGLKAPAGESGPVYSRDWAASGFYRRGVSDHVTLGVNGQAESRSWMAGAEALASTPLGIVSFQTAASGLSGAGFGYAAGGTFQRRLQSNGSTSDNLSLSAQYWSRNFGPAGQPQHRNPYSVEVGGAYSHAFSERFYAGLDLHYSRGRDGVADAQIYNVNAGIVFSHGIDLRVQAIRQTAGVLGRPSIAVLLSLTARVGRGSSVRADYDGRTQSSRLGFNAVHGDGVGAYSIDANVEHSLSGFGLNANGTYATNRADLGLSQFSSFGGGSGVRATSRTSLRIGSSLAWADGAISVGRPINDAFAIVASHPSLHGAKVMVDPTPEGFRAITGLMPDATVPDLPSYIPRTLGVEAPDAPAGVDLGRGSFRVMAPYRGGYRLQVGSDYSVTVLGRLLGHDGLPVKFAAGEAREMARPTRAPVVLFTNGDGRFGIAGVKPGRWRIEMQSDPPSAFVIDVPAGSEGGIPIGDLKPAESVQ